MPHTHILRKVCCHRDWRVASPDLVSPPHFSPGKPRLREGVGPVPGHTALRPAPPQGGSLGAGSIVLFPSRKPLCSAAWAAGEEERVWLRDWQALEAEPGSELRKNNHLGAAGAGRAGWAHQGGALPGTGEACQAAAYLRDGAGRWPQGLCPDLWLLGAGVHTWVGCEAKWCP